MRAILLLVILADYRSVRKILGGVFLGNFIKALLMLLH